MNKNDTEKVVFQMTENDLFSKWLGIEVIAVAEGYSKTRMTVRDEMMNGLGIVHGGVTFSLADSTFAFAATIETTCPLHWILPSIF